MWGQAVERICERQGLSVEAASDLFGHSRQAYYQQRDRNRNHLAHERAIVEMAQSIREEDAERQQLLAQITGLQRQLEKSEMEKLALNTLIDIAEEQGIQIRKKSGAKQ